MNVFKSEARFLLSIDFNTVRLTKNEASHHLKVPLLGTKSFKTCKTYGGVQVETGNLTKEGSCYSGFARKKEKN